MHVMKMTEYFKFMHRKPDRQLIKPKWIESVINEPEFAEVQDDGRIRLWRKIPEYGNRYLRVILLSDRETVHNAFFDRGFNK